MKEEIQRVWVVGQPSCRVEDIKQKLATLSQSLRRWDRDTFGLVRSEIKKLKLELGRLRGDPACTGPSHAEQKVHERLVKLYHREEIMWLQ